MQELRRPIRMKERVDQLDANEVVNLPSELADSLVKKGKAEEVSSEPKPSETKVVTPKKKKNGDDESESESDDEAERRGKTKSRASPRAHRAATRSTTKKTTARSKRATKRTSKGRK